MKAQFKVRANLILEIEADKQAELFRALASAQEVFGAAHCVKCKSTNLSFNVRQNKEDDDFFEIICGDCYAKLAMGQHKKGGTLYPQRQRQNEDGEREWLPDNGWMKWDREKKKLI